MQITFVLPGSSRLPVGGYKVVYEYANHLSARGHRVTVVLPAMIDPAVSARERLYHVGRYLLWGSTNRFGPKTWFQLRPEVRLKWVLTLDERNIPTGDAIVATGWPTAEYVARYGASKGKKFYFLQHFENWYGPDERVRATWRLPLRKIVIANWLRELAQELGETAAYIPNGLDFSAFGCDIAISERREPHVAMLYHQFDWKGSTDGLLAMEVARRSVPELSATVFSVYDPPANLPRWIEYVQNAPQQRLRSIYNRASVFLAPSWAEGWPLPPAEAMMSGAALVCTDIGGHREYAVHEQNALLAPARQPEALASALVRMLTDHTLRHRLATTALEDIGRFTWESAVNKFEAELLRSV